MGNDESERISCGFRIIRVSEGSPAQAARLSPYIDFLIYNSDISGKRANDEFLNMINMNAGSPVSFKVFSLLTKQFRNVRIKLNSKESGKEILGAKLSCERIDEAYQNIFKVLRVEPDSPFEKAGIEPLNDYILAIDDLEIDGINQLDQYIKAKKDKEIEFCIFNIEKIIIQFKKVIPNNNWGDKDELIGAELGFGPSYRMPIFLVKSNNEVDKESEKQINSNESQEKQKNENKQNQRMEEKNILQKSQDMPDPKKENPKFNQSENKEDKQVSKKEEVAKIIEFNNIMI